MIMDLMRCKTLCTLVLLVLVPQLALATTPPVTDGKPTQLPLLTDIALQQGGTLVGRLTDSKGMLLQQEKITIRQDQQMIAETTTDKNGQFRVNGLRGGIYEVASARGAGSFRAWAANTAPPTARQFAVLIENDDVVRGQFGWMADPGQNYGLGLSAAQWVGIAVGTAGIVVGTIALVRSDDAS